MNNNVNKSLTIFSKVLKNLLKIVHFTYKVEHMADDDKVYWRY